MSSSSDPAKASYPGRIATLAGPGYPKSEQGPLHLLTLSTPNGQKVQLGLEELVDKYGKDKIKFTWDYVDIWSNMQKEPWFLKLNGNGRIPTLVDNTKESLDVHGQPFPIMEAGAILLYLAKLYDPADEFGFSDPLEQNVCLQWMFFQTGGVGPMQGQLNHFNIYAEQKIPYAIKRYKDETLRLYGVIEGRLSGAFIGAPKRCYLAGKGEGKYSWADINMVPWVARHEYSGISDEEMAEKFPHTVWWLQRISTRPAFKRALEGYGKPEEK